MPRGPPLRIPGERDRGFRASGITVEEWQAAGERPFSTFHIQVFSSRLRDLYSRNLSLEKTRGGSFAWPTSMRKDRQCSIRPWSEIYGGNLRRLVGSAATRMPRNQPSRP